MKRVAELLFAVLALDGLGRCWQGSGSIGQAVSQMARLTSLTIIVLLLGARASSAAAPIVVVFDVELQGLKLSKVQRTYLNDQLSSEIAITGKYRIILRTCHNKLLMDRKKRSNKACSDQACQIELGRLLAADKILTSKVIKQGSECTLAIRVLNLKTAATQKVATIQCGCNVDDLVEALTQAVMQLTGPKIVESVQSPDGGGESQDQSEDDQKHERAIKAAQNKLKCKSNNAKACKRYGDELNYGFGVAQDKLAAVEYYDKACKLGRYRGCVNAGLLYSISGDSARASPYEKMELDLLEADCRSNPSDICAMAARIYSSGSLYGDSIPINMEKARELYRLGCDHDGARACQDLGRLAEIGVGAIEDLNEAIRLYDKACKIDGLIWGCEYAISARQKLEEQSE